MENKQLLNNSKNIGQEVPSNITLIKFTLMNFYGKKTCMEK